MDPIVRLCLGGMIGIIGALLLIEGLAIVRFEKKIVPFPTRIRYIVSGLLQGKEKSDQWLAAQISPKALYTYAALALISGTALLLIGFDEILIVLSAMPH